MRQRLRVSVQEDRLTDAGNCALGFEDHETEWTTEEALRIAECVLPACVEMDEPYLNVSFVEHHECFNATLADEAAESVYAYVDNNPTPGQCSLVLSPVDNDEGLSFTVQLQIDDPSWVGDRDGSRRCKCGLRGASARSYAKRRAMAPCFTLLVASIQRSLLLEAA